MKPLSRLHQRLRSLAHGVAAIRARHRTQKPSVLERGWSAAPAFKRRIGSTAEQKERGTEPPRMMQRPAIFAENMRGSHMGSPLELVDQARFLASGQDDPHSTTITELCNALEAVVRRYAAACDALDFAHSEGFEWPHDPFGEVALAFANVDAADDRLTSAIEARSDATPQSDAAEGESATRQGDAHD